MEPVLCGRTGSCVKGLVSDIKGHPASTTPYTLPHLETQQAVITGHSQIYFMEIKFGTIVVSWSPNMIFEMKGNKYV